MSFQVRLVAIPRRSQDFHFLRQSQHLGPHFPFPSVAPLPLITVEAYFSNECSNGGITMTELTIDNFQKQVLESDVPVLVDFWSPTCGPCRQIAPVIEQLAEEADGRFRVGKINVF